MWKPPVPCKVCRRRNLALAHGLILEAEGTVWCPTEASRGRYGVGGELAALSSDVSSLVCSRDLVLLQLRACGRAVLAQDENTPKWRCSCRLQRVSGLGGRGGMESCWYFQVTNEMWRGIKLLYLSRTRQYHWSISASAPCTPAQHLTWVLMLLR